jgi:hypothetical protein
MYVVHSCWICIINWISRHGGCWKLNCTLGGWAGMVMYGICVFLLSLIILQALLMSKTQPYQGWAGNETWHIDKETQTYGRKRWENHWYWAFLLFIDFMRTMGVRPYLGRVGGNGYAKYCYCTGLWLCMHLKNLTVPFGKETDWIGKKTAEKMAYVCGTFLLNLYYKLDF